MKDSKIQYWKNQRFKDKKIGNKIPKLFADSKNQSM